MKALNLARKYATALFESIQEESDLDLIFKELKEFRQAFKTLEVENFFSNPLYSQADRVKVIGSMVGQLKISETLKNFLILLANKNRFQILPEITDSFQVLVDNKNGVTRGEVVSSHTLSPGERERIEDIVSKRTKKRVILTYREDPHLLGGLIAKVDGYTFDDTLTMHLGLSLIHI